jgi:hypothetical protein
MTAPPGRAGAWELNRGNLVNRAGVEPHRGHQLARFSQLVAPHLRYSRPALSQGNSVDALRYKVGVTVVAGVLPNYVHVGHAKRKCFAAWTLIWVALVTETFGVTAIERVFPRTNKSARGIHGDHDSRVIGIEKCPSTN